MIDEHQLWAKADPNDPSSYHPLSFHLIDTAVVAIEMWDRCLSKPTRSLIEKYLNLSEADARAWTAFIAGCHDIGKATPAFQKRNEIRMKNLVSQGLYFFNGSRHHGILSEKISLTYLSGKMDGDQVSIISSAIGAHHGNYQSKGNLLYVDYNDLGDGEWDNLRRKILDDLFLILSMDERGNPSGSDRDTADAFLFLITGLISIADWIASAIEFFPYTPEDLSSEEYLNLSKQRAKEALTRLNWPESGSFHASHSFSDLFPEITKPFPLQSKMIEALVDIQGQGMVVIEAPMGEGKTESALFLMENWNHSTGNSGSYLALPTMATANQMFQRLQKLFINLSPKEKRNLVLVHGHAVLSNSHQCLDVTDTMGDPDDSVALSEWFTYRKRGLISPFGVGTIDQTFLAVMPTKHFFVRLFGLAGKTVIFDEVHAYDVYMSEIFERELAWLAALGTNVIILSATLPRERLNGLLQAYGQGSKVEDRGKYPRMTALIQGQTRVHQFQSAADVGMRRSLNLSIDWLPDDLDFLSRKALDEVKQGGNLAIICNTVAYAQSLFLKLRSMNSDSEIELSLFHARFPFEERSRLEKGTLSAFGKGERSPDMKRILVATQVVEQSLDLDFDILITQIAPIDLLIQRIGRLHRHERSNRPGSLRNPRTYIISPIIEDGRFDFGASSRVYSDYVLLRTLAVLKNRTQMNIPGDIEELVEAVYGQFVPNMPSDWKNALDGYKKKWLEENDDRRSMADNRVIFPPNHPDILLNLKEPLEEDRSDVHRSLQALTRISPPSVNAICLFSFQNVLYTDALKKEPIQIDDIGHQNVIRLLSRSVSISNHAVVEHFSQHVEVPASWRRSALLRNHRPIIFSESIMEGRFTYVCGNMIITLDGELGIIIEKLGDDVEKQF